MEVWGDVGKVEKGVGKSVGRPVGVRERCVEGWGCEGRCEEMSWEVCWGVGMCGKMWGKAWGCGRRYVECGEIRRKMWGSVLGWGEVEKDVRKGVGRYGDVGGSSGEYGKMWRKLWESVLGCGGS